MRVEQFLIQVARRTPDKVALIAGDRRLTFAGIDRASDGLARALVRAGVARGDGVVVFSPVNCRASAVLTIERLLPVARGTMMPARQATRLLVLSRSPGVRQH